MSKDVKKSLLPKLRFPEFKEAGAWKQLPIGKKVDLLSGYPFKSSEISEDASGIPLMRGINITEGIIRHSKDMDRYYLGSTDQLEKYFVQTNDLVIGMDGSKVGKNSALITDDDAGSLLIQRVARLRTSCKATISFIFQHIHSTKFHSYVDRINTSGGIPHISAKQINEFEICFPPVEKEQQKIADCLSSVDELITAQAQKVDALKAHKKGLMQQLFPAEGETIPKLRFPEFQDAGEWTEGVLGDVGKVSMCKRIMKHETSESGDIPFYKIGTFGKTPDAYISKELYDLYRGKFSFPKRGDILISASGTIGRTVVYD
ncbi:MAG: restriction endonuclease subunit S, partial [Gammaproteobacteria bacterium]|nr:restriction endonuclease subunit S [Gammaproteobacteria bacterium]